MEDYTASAAETPTPASDKPASSFQDASSTARQPSPDTALPPIGSPAKQNNIGFIRLLAASMVIVSHSAEMIDGNRSREPLTWLFGTVSFGELGVDIFFLVSGYLITKSYLTSGGLSYLIKRVRRIYPGYLVAYAVSIMIVAPLAGIALSSLRGADYLNLGLHAMWLDMPKLEGAFRAQHYHLLNGAMWTISYEFRCYLFVMLAGALGLYKKRPVAVCLAIVFLLLHWWLADDWNPRIMGWFVLKEVTLGHLGQQTRFLFIFTSGSLFYLFRDKIRYTGSAAFLCILTLVVFMFSTQLAEPVLCTLGAYALFYFAFEAKPIDINRRYDISYGVYLYAWPFAALLLLYHPAITQAYLSVFTFIFAVIAGTISWHLIEKPATRLLRGLPERLPRGGDGFSCAAGIAQSEKTL